MGVYYNRQTPNQMKGEITRPVAGLNEYNPSISINDNYMTDVLDAAPYRNELMKMNSASTMAVGVFNGTGNLDGIIMEARAIQGQMTLGVSDEGYALLVFKKDDTTWSIRKAKDSTPLVTKYALTTYGLPTTSVGDYIYSSCNFTTEINRFVCFTCSYVKILMYYNYVTNTVGKVALPFTPKRIVTHASRIFAIDTGNKIWWCRAGDIYSWYGIEYDDDRVATTANMANVAYTIIAQPDVPRPLSATTTAVTGADTQGIVTFVGTDIFDAALTEVVTPISGQRVQTLKAFKTLTSATGSGWVINGGNDTIILGVAPISSGYVQDDAGYWTFEKEKTITDLCVLSNNLYLFAPDNIYVFRGYSPDTFTLSQSIADTGIKENTTPSKWLATVSNHAYFYNNGDIYEFDGANYPRLISHTMVTNGAITNGIMGGIDELSTSYDLVADNDNLYVYLRTTLLHDINTYYVFDSNIKTWWKRSGFSKHNSVYSTTAFKVQYVTMTSTDSIVAFVSVNSTIGSFDMHYSLGHLGLYSPFIITKAFNSSPSELGTLTSIILQIRGEVATPSDIILSYSVTANADDFIEFKTYTAYTFNADIENIDIPVPSAYIANAHHYRIKIECSAYTEIYNIERRFRIRGRSR